jgi:hypothetical protein
MHPSEWLCRAKLFQLCQDLRIMCSMPQEKGSHPLAHEIQAGSFLMPIGARLKDGQVDKAVAPLRSSLAAS